jgi:HSP20 family protein
MLLTKRNDWAYPATLPQFLDNFFDREFFDWNNRNHSETGTTLPAINVQENVEGFTVEMAAPGMKKEDFKIELNNNLLTISSEKREENKENTKGTYSRKEFSYQSFVRSFALPNIADGEKIEAKYADGVLHISIPKKEEAKPKPVKMIQIG